MSSPWTRRSDRLVAAGIVLAVVAAALLLWTTSESKATRSSTAAAPSKLAEPDRFPAELTERWRAPNGRAPTPVADETAVVTGDGGTVTGRDPLTGKQRWHYERDRSLCTLGGAWSKAIAVYDNGSGSCSEVTQLDAATGKRTAERNGDAESGTQLLTDQSHIVTTGRKLINVWSQDLIKSMEYGDVPAPINPGLQPRAGCTYDSIAVDGGRVAVVEHCPKDGNDRLTIVQTTNDDEDSDAEDPKIACSTRLSTSDAQVVAMTGSDNSLVALRSAGSAELSVYRSPSPQSKKSEDDEDPPELACQKRGQFRAELPAADAESDEAELAVRSKRIGGTVYWHSGSATVALDGDSLRPKWTVRDTIGTPTLFADELVLPRRSGLSVINPENGRSKREISLERKESADHVELDAAGPVLLEQRGETLVALR